MNLVPNEQADSMGAVKFIKLASNYGLTVCVMKYCEMYKRDG